MAAPCFDVFNAPTLSESVIKRKRQVDDSADAAADAKLAKTSALNPDGSLSGNGLTACDLDFRPRSESFGSFQHQDYSIETVLLLGFPPTLISHPLRSDT